MEEFNTIKGFSTIEEVLDELRQGKIVLVTDDESRENEGDFICAAQHATTENVNFMAVHGKGLICMPMSPELCTRLKLPQMVSHNSDNHETAFTVSIDHISTSTGISAAERGVTARQCVNARSRPEDFRRPGHMFPLAARKNGVLERAGHTEATVDLMRLAGLSECGLCCEIMKEDGTMMRMPQLLKLAGQWNMKITTIKALQNYRKQHDKLVECAAVTHMPTRYGTFKAFGYRNLLNGEHHVALVKGEIGDGRDLLCRVHSECLTGDAFGSLRCDCGQQFAAAMARIEQEGRGVLLYMRQEGRGIGLLNKLRAYELQDQGMERLIIDLRGNPGGLVTAVCDTLRQILPEGLIVYTEDKNGKREEYTCDGDTPISIPLVVLVNENTASAAEIFTGAVKDYGIGTIVGTTTFGKGIVQNTFQLSDGSVVKLTIAHYYTPLGNDIHKVGITPDVEVELPDDATSDVQLEKALEVVKGLESAE